MRKWYADRAIPQSPQSYYFCYFDTKVIPRFIATLMLQIILPLLQFPVIFCAPLLHVPVSMITIYKRIIHTYSQSAGQKCFAYVYLLIYNPVPRYLTRRLVGFHHQPPPNKPNNCVDGLIMEPDEILKIGLLCYFDSEVITCFTGMMLQIILLQSPVVFCCPLYDYKMQKHSR